MQERIVEIIVFLVNELRSSKRLNDVDVSMLTKDGYTQSEISTAFSWLFERLSIGQAVTDPVSPCPTSHRQLNDVERTVIQSEAYGYLLQCRQLGLLTSEELETVIDHIMSAGFGSIGVAEMKSFVAGFLFDPERNDAKISLGLNDTIH